MNECLTIWDLIELSIGILIGTVIYGVVSLASIEVKFRSERDFDFDKKNLFIKYFIAIKKEIIECFSKSNV